MGNSSSNTRGLLFDASVNTSSEANKQIQKNIFENMTSIMNENYLSQNIITASTQQLEISNVMGCGTEGINIEGIKQDNTSYLDVSQVTQTSNTSDLTKQIEQAIEATLTSVQEAQAKGLYDVAVNYDIKTNESIQEISQKVATEIVNKNIQSFNSDLSNNQFIKISNLSTCEVGKNGAGGPINVADISQSNAFTVYSAQIATTATDLLQEYIDVSSSTVTLSTTQKAVAGGIGVLVFLILVGIIVGVVIGIKKKRERARLQQQAAATQQQATKATPSAAPAPSSITGTVQEVAKNPQVQQGFKKATGFIGNLFKK